MEFFENAWRTLGMLAVIGLVVIGSLFLLAPHDIRGYYLNYAAGGAVPAFCVMANMSWGPDFNVFCAPSINDAGEVLDYLKAEAHPRLSVEVTP